MGLPQRRPDRPVLLFDLIHLISPRPLLMIAGTEADTAYFSRQAIEKANEPKELFWIEGATHIDLYDKDACVPTVVTKMASFFKESLAATAEPVSSASSSDGVWDALHINSVDEGPDGRPLISARNMWAIYHVTKRGEDPLASRRMAKRLPLGPERGLLLAA
ncbi:arylsulfotransferase family protein [Streptomyces sp. NPDC051664]|uniref:alpha/beta hydrolase n=1 Tax=Streptomyces sp. NPDC051664 TaxID=3365668 RepID=UPI0037A7F115